MSFLRRRPRAGEDGATGGPEGLGGAEGPEGVEVTDDGPPLGAAVAASAEPQDSHPEEVPQPEPEEDDAPDPAPDRSDGPWDLTERPPGTAPEQWVDLGALQLPVVTGMELRLEVEEGTSRVVAVTVVIEESALQIQAFAAPRTRGIWRSVRREIASSVAEQGGACEEVSGRFGAELLAQVPAMTPDGQQAQQLVRFLGVDGPRWFLRGVLSGAAAVDDEAAAGVMGVLRGAVVVRGEEAMAPRDLLDLRLPRTDDPPSPTQEES